MEREVCLRCGGKMTCIGQQFLKKGAPGWRLRGAVELESMNGLLPVELWCCQSCRHLDFYLAENPAGTEASGIAKVPCPYCGQLHELDDARCPHCGKRLSE